MSKTNDSYIPATPPKSKRGRSRMLAMQGMYQWLMTGNDYAAIEPRLREEPGFGKADVDWFTHLFEGTFDHREALEIQLIPCLDRAIIELSPIERAILLVAAFEMCHCPEVPFQVVINEAVELAKCFGGTDGHKYVNGVLNRLAHLCRPLETMAVKNMA